MSPDKVPFPVDDETMLKLIERNKTNAIVVAGVIYPKGAWKLLNEKQPKFWNCRGCGKHKPVNEDRFCVKCRNI